MIDARYSIVVIGGGIVGLAVALEITGRFPGLRMVSREELREIAPPASGRGAVFVPSTGVTDYALASEKYAQLMAAQGGTILTSAEVTNIYRRPDEIVVQTQRGAFSANYLINCAGLFSDRISRMAGDEPQVMVVPFPGEYYELGLGPESLVRAWVLPGP